MPYSQITISAPSSAQEGAVVNVSAKVANVSAYTDIIFRTEIHKVPALHPGMLLFTKEEVISVGSPKVYNASFFMPDCDTTILVWVEYLAFDLTRWIYDNAASQVVALGVEVPPEFQNLTATYAKV